MRGQNTRSIGKEKEEQAAAYLAERGVQLLCKNFRCKCGEIDLIGQDKEYLVFFEVKYRRNGEFQNPLAAVGYTKQKKICRTADFYRYTRGLSPETPVRYDVVGICREEIVWIQNAFPHIYTRV